MSILILSGATTFLPDGTVQIPTPPTQPRQPPTLPPPVVPPPNNPPCPTITVTPATFPSGTVGVAYSQACGASGGTGPYTYTFAGALPAGLTLSSSGVLSGTPTVATTITVSIRATDSLGCFGTLVAPVLVSPAPTNPCPTITVTPQAFPIATVGVAYSQQFTASGGQAPYAFTSPTLPPGLAVNSSGLLSGTPTSAVTFTATITVTDANGCPGSVSGSLVVQPAPPPPPPPVPPTPIPPGSQRIVAQADITYKGCFRLPGAANTQFAYGNITGRVVNGQTNLFVYGENPILGDPVYELVDPGVYSLDYHTAPVCQLYANWGNIYGGKRISYLNGAPINLGYQVPGALYWNPLTQLLYWTYYDSYNVGGRNDWGLGASQLIDPVAGTSFAYGPWRVTCTDADGVVHYGPTRCLTIWPSPLDGTLCASGITNSQSGSTPGPSMFNGLAWPTTTTPTDGTSATDLAQPTRSLNHYFMGNPLSPSGDYFNPDGSVHGNLRAFRRRLNQAVFEGASWAGQPLRANPALNAGVGSWSGMDSATGGIWLQLTHVRGVIFSASLAGAVSQDTTDCVNSGHEWYSNAGADPPIGACAHGCPPPIDITGPMTTAAFPAFIIYNPDDLASAAAGSIPDYSPEPTSVIDLETTYGVQTAPVTTQGAGKSVNGFYFDPVRKYLFCVSHQVDATAGPDFVQSIIHVFAINDVP